MARLEKELVVCEYWGWQRRRDKHHPKTSHFCALYRALSALLLSSPLHTHRCIPQHPWPPGHGSAAGLCCPPASWCISHWLWALCVSFSTPRRQPRTARTAEWLLHLLWLLHPSSPSGSAQAGLGGSKGAECGTMAAAQVTISRGLTSTSDQQSLS